MDDVRFDLRAVLLMALLVAGGIVVVWPWLSKGSQKMRMTKQTRKFLRALRAIVAAS
jgi:hypothetical protein